MALLSGLLEKLNVKVVTAVNGEDGIGQIAGDPKSFDIVFLDIRMPGMKGPSVAREMRSKGYQGSIIAFTASVSGKGRQDSMAAGVDLYLSKDTISPDLLKALLQKYCARRGDDDTAAHAGGMRGDSEGGAQEKAAKD